MQLPIYRFVVSNATFTNVLHISNKKQSKNSYLRYLHTVQEYAMAGELSYNRDTSTKSELQGSYREVLHRSTATSGHPSTRQNRVTVHIIWTIVVTTRLQSSNKLLIEAHLGLP